MDFSQNVLNTNEAYMRHNIKIVNISSYSFFMHSYFILQYYNREVELLNVYVYGYV